MKSSLKAFEITKLFNKIDVNLPLDNRVNIFLGENGIGKTTILNCLYYVLSGKIEKLNSIIFDKITVAFDDISLFITHADVVAYVEDFFDNSYKRNSIRFDHLFSDLEIKHLINLKHHNLEDTEEFEKFYYRISDFYRIPTNYAKRELERYILFLETKALGSSLNVQNFKKEINARVKNNILYFPTYRRIEEDISRLEIDIEKERIKDKLIQFGMGDVKTTIDKLLGTIQTATIKSFNKMTGILLKQYLNNELFENGQYFIDTEKLNIALDRIGDEIESMNKTRIKDLVESSEIYKKENIYLLNLIKNLIKSYEKQNAYDERVKKFVNVCNNYLNKKRYIYDESKVELGIFRNKSKDQINIQNLSSGEKQIISIFSKLYLENQEEKCIILFDEPELSLSVKWQAMFLPDIMKSDICSMLIAVTHSPFIFDNEFDCIAKDIENCLTDLGE